MGARILDGAAVARTIRAELAPRVAAFTARAGRPPGLGILLVGDHAASEIYVRNKQKAAAEIGIRVDLVRLPSTTSIDELRRRVAALNESPIHDGILVQSPLPASLDGGAERRVFDTISPAKDVDGLNPINVGRLVQNRSCLTPCTPTGVMELLDRTGIEIAGRHAVIVGRSDIVGKPMALLLLHRHATVTICHSRTHDLPVEAGRADILVAAIGRPYAITRDFVKTGATVIDIGINRISEARRAKELLDSEPTRLAEFDRRGAIVLGDVHPDVAGLAGALTPVPGGVGPLTIAMLLANTLKAAEPAGDWSS